MQVRQMRAQMKIQQEAAAALADVEGVAPPQVQL